ncbi:glycosyltransferase family 1 protein [Flavobacterium piscinae]|uniref:Glycosyltransferase family 1 protein n=1 Tax=Flavobacterium piscinae TaxID=2506424 RepID=A0A4Q1KQ53_9FLAO|nr:glycosyltransferase [Flavobacterium piscinae]RXR32117.1 glycosyltransferase family 1 protein [Flavobacterium piscinae]
MRILLVGEYSRLHNSLKEGLISLGHEVILVSHGDHFKNYSSDYSIKPIFFSRFWITKKVRNAFKRFFSFDFEKMERAIRFYLILPKLKGFDHVQLINSDALELHPKVSLFFYKKLFAQNKKASLLVCGDETPVIEYLLKNEMKHSILSPYLNDSSLKKQYRFSLKYLQPTYKKVFNWLKDNVNSIIVSDMDYKIPMEKMNYKVNFIPNPINTHKILFSELKMDEKIIIFLGINRLSYDKKGIHFFEKALKIIEGKYADKVEIIITENIPYQHYISLYNKAHILLDQVYAYDQGYNALEAMAKGKVVFTGAEQEFEDYYELNERVAINALPEVNELVNELSFLIDNPQEIITIGKNARAFIEREHDYLKIAKKYLEVWK